MELRQSIIIIVFGIILIVLLSHIYLGQKETLDEKICISRTVCVESEGGKAWYCRVPKGEK